MAKNQVRIDRPAARSGMLALAGILGALATAWAAFQWWELVVARSGGQVYCAPGGGGHCAEIWDSPFAAAVHASSGLPVAGWGVAWGLLAFAFPLVARAQLARRRTADLWLAATVCVSVSGALGVALLLGASLRFGHICATCGLTYLLTLAYAGTCYLALRGAAPRGLTRGAGLAASGLALGFALLIGPGLRTPQNPSSSGSRAIAAIAPLPPGSSDDQELARLLHEAPEQVRQLISDMLADRAANPVWDPPPARTVIGPPGARLVLTEWSDTLCSHCAELHEALLKLQERLGPDTFSLAPHQYPLDSACNPGIDLPSSHPLSCTSARVQICAEGRPGAFELTGELFRRQKELTEPLLLEIAGRVVPPAELEACIHSPETEQKLQADISWAREHAIVGTPLLLVGGRKTLPYPPLLYALALTRGASSNGAFAALPPPQPIPVPH